LPTYIDIATVASTQTSYEVTNLQPGDYTYRIIASNPAGDSSPSNEATAVISTIGPPPAPTGLTAAQGVPAQSVVTLDWTNTTNADTYSVERAASSTGTWTVVVTGLTVSAYSVINLTVNTQYFFRVKAHNGAGASLPSAAVNITTAPQETSGACPTGAIRLQPSDNIVSIIQGAGTNKTFCFADGTYNIGTQIISPPAGSRLTAQNAATLGTTAKSNVFTVRPKATIIGHGIEVFNCEGRSGVRFENLQIEGARGSSACKPNCGRGVKASTGGTEIAYCRITDCDNQAIGQGIVTCHHSELDNCGTNLGVWSGTGGGIKTTHQIDAHHNYVHDCGGTAIWLDCNANWILCYDNLMEYVEDFGIHYEITNGDVDASGNPKSKCYNNVSKRIGYNRSNVSYNGAGAKGSGIGLVSSRNIDVYNNHGENNARAAITCHERNLSSLNNCSKQQCSACGWTLSRVLVHNNTSSPANHYSGLSHSGVVANANT